MSLSLRDQLLQAGLINEKQAKQAAKQKFDTQRQQARSPTPAIDEKKLALQREAESKCARDQELNRQRQEKIERTARRAQIKQLVDQNRVAKAESGDPYNFVDGKKIRRIPVDAATREALGRGSLMIVRCDGRYELVPAAIAERIAERDAHAVIPRVAEPAKIVDDNDPYKDFVVPDDLMW